MIIAALSPVAIFESVHLIAQSTDFEALILNELKTPASVDDFMGRKDGNMNAQNQETGTTQNATESTPFLSTWQTSMGASIGGVILNLAGGRIADYVPDDYLFELGVVSIAGLIVQIVYAIAVYPSFFRKDPYVNDSTLVSFLNCLLGGIIFGPLWNSNLTNRTKGVSFIVFAILVALVLIMEFYLYMTLLFV